MSISSNKAKKASVALLAAVLVLTSSFASVMTGCGDKEKSTSTASSSVQTTASTDSTAATNEKSESDADSQNSQANNTNSDNAQTSEKSESNGSASTVKSDSQNNDSANKTSDNNSNNSSDKNNSNNQKGDVLTVDGHEYKKGDTVTVTYSVKSTKVLANYQATIKYDSSKLKVSKSVLQSPAKTNGIINAKTAGQILFNGSDITTGYDYTNGGDLVVITYEAIGTGSTDTSFTWVSASTIENNKIITHIDENGKSDGTVTLSTSYN